MAEKITKPMLLDETGKALVEAVQQIAEKMESGTGSGGSADLTIGTVTSGSTASASITDGKTESGTSQRRYRSYGCYWIRKATPGRKRSHRSAGSKGRKGGQG